MASPQKENGFTPVANELLEAFIQVKLTEYERVVVLAIWRKTYGWSKKDDRISNSQISAITGIPRPHVSRTLGQLKAKNIVTSRGNLVGVNKDWEGWKCEQRELPHQVTGVTSPGNKKLPDQVHTKERKETIQKKPAPRGASDKIIGMKNTSLIADVIKAFESVDPKNKNYYGNTTQRAAVQFLLDEYGFEEVTKRISWLPKTNTMPYFPNITTPCQLRDKWTSLENAVARARNEQQTKSAKIAF